MKPFFIFLIAFMASCGRKEPQREPQQQALATAETAEAAVPDTIAFKPFHYDFSDYYVKALTHNIIPHKKYQYWAYLTGYAFNIKFKDSLPLLNEEGDTLLRSKIKIPNINGFFKGGQFTMRSDYVAFAENDSLRLITTNAGFRDFLGTIDNIDEAVLLAKSYYYIPEHNSKDGDYRIINGNYEMHLVQVDPFPNCSGYVDPNSYKTVTVTKDGFIKVVSRQKNNEANPVP